MTARNEAVANKVLELIESARKWGWRQAGGGVGDKEMEEQTKLRASELAALLTTRKEVAPVAWPPRAMRGDGYVTIGPETLPMMSGCPACHADEAGTWNRCLDECQRATAKAGGIGGDDSHRLARWLEIHYRGNFSIPEIREIHAALLGVYTTTGQTSDARDGFNKHAGIYCLESQRVAIVEQHEWPEGIFRNVWITYAQEPQS